jgi:hypothetical protein
MVRCAARAVGGSGGHYAVVVARKGFGGRGAAPVRNILSAAYIFQLINEYRGAYRLALTPIQSSVRSRHQ